MHHDGMLEDQTLIANHRLDLGQQPRHTLDIINPDQQKRQVCADIDQGGLVHTAMRAEADDAAKDGRACRTLALEEVQNREIQRLPLPLRALKHKKLHLLHCDWLVIHPRSSFYAAHIIRAGPLDDAAD
jgi:hypothetical protein